MLFLSILAFRVQKTFATDDEINNEIKAGSELLKIDGEHYTYNRKLASGG